MSLNRTDIRFMRRRDERVGYITGALACVALSLLTVLSIEPFVIEPRYLALAVGGLGSVALLALSLARFERFVILLIAIRPAIDGLNPGDGGLSPSVGVGLVFIFASGAWLANRWRSGSLLFPSAASWGLGALVAAAGLSCLVSRYPALSLAATLRLTAGWLMLVVIEQLLWSDVSYRGRAIKALFFAGASVTVWSMLEMVTGTAAFDDDSGLMRADGPFVHPNVLAKFLTVLALLIVAYALFSRQKHQWALWLCLAPVAAVIAMTYARVAWIATTIGILYLLGKRNWKYIPVVLIGLLLAVISVPALYARVADLWAPPPAAGVPDNSLVWRIQYWQTLLQYARLSPFNGTGIGTIPIIGGEGLAAHNVWIQAYVEMGVAGVAAMCALVAGFWVTLRGRRDVCAVPPFQAAVSVALSMFATTLTENLINETTTVWYACVVVALGYTSASHVEGKSPELADQEPSS